MGTLIRLLARRRKPIGDRPGQMIILFALALTTLLGMAALAVDVGHAFERRQFVQGVANDTARAGAYEVYEDLIANNFTDSQVVNRMVDTLNQSGLSPFNPTLAHINGSACALNVPTNKAILEAYYLGATNWIVSLSGATSGNFTLTTSGGTGGTTSPIIATASAATVLSALASLTDVGTGNVTVTGNNGGPYSVAFGGTAKVNELTAAGTGGTTVNVTAPTTYTTTYPVGGGTIPGAAQNIQVAGVQVTRLEMCVPHFFAGVLGFGKFVVASDSSQSLVGWAKFDATTTGGGGGGGGGTPSQNPAAQAPYYVFARVQCTDSPTHPSPACAATPYRLFALGSPDTFGGSNYANDHTKYGVTYQSSPNTSYPAPTCPTGLICSGDLVTLHNHDNSHGNWDAWQFVQPWYSLANQASPALPLGSASNRGCLDYPTPNLGLGEWSFNHPGTGNCAASLTDGSVVDVPLVDQVCKNGSCGISADSTGTIGSCRPGGYCARIVAFVQITVVRSYASDGFPLDQGYITGVIDDPYCTVEAPTSQTHPVYWSTVASGPGTALDSKNNTDATLMVSLVQHEATDGTGTTEWTVVPSSTANGGTFQLSVTNAWTTITTSSIAYGAGASTVQTALAALGNVGNHVTVTAISGGYDIKLTGAAAGDQPISGLPFPAPLSNTQACPPNVP